VGSWQWRFWASAVLSVPVFFISFLFPHLPEVDDAFDEELTQGSYLLHSRSSSLTFRVDVLFGAGLSVGVFLCWLLATPIQFVMAWPLYGSSYRALRYGHKANMDTLVILSTLTAYTYSVVAVIVAMAGTGFEGEATSQSIPLSQPVTTKALCGAGDSFFETSAILLTLIMLGRYLEALARGKACNVVSSLRNEQATTALLLGVGESDCSDTTSEQSTQEREMDVELIQPGDLIKVLTHGNDALCRSFDSFLSKYRFSISHKLRVVVRCCLAPRWLSTGS
jgi:Cu+-exporting ATPase